MGRIPHCGIAIALVLLAGCGYWVDPHYLEPPGPKTTLPNIYLVTFSDKVTDCALDFESKSDHSFDYCHITRRFGKVGDTEHFCMQWSRVEAFSLTDITLTLADGKKRPVKVNKGVDAGQNMYIVVNADFTVSVSSSPPVIEVKK